MKTVGRARRGSAGARRVSMATLVNSVCVQLRLFIFYVWVGFAGF